MKPFRSTVPTSSMLTVVRTWGTWTHTYSLWQKKHTNKWPGSYVWRRDPSGTGSAGLFIAQSTHPLHSVGFVGQNRTRNSLSVISRVCIRGTKQASLSLSLCQTFRKALYIEKPQKNKLNQTQRSRKRRKHFSKCSFPNGKKRSRNYWDHTWNQEYEGSSAGVRCSGAGLAHALPAASNMFCLLRALIHRL